jgi:dihydrofolate synthase/folylpolyglutamate synthase
MTYRETLAYLSSLNPLGIHFGLDTIRSLLNRMNDPQGRFPSVLIAGTNGKGSVAAMTAAILSTAGFRTGLYTSPDLIDIRERIQIDGRMISREEMSFCVDEVRSRIREEVSYFEFLTATAFLHFQRRQADIAVLEVGMGGRLDATNVVTPLASVITNISLEHRQYLGNTLQKIAFEKAGIIQAGGVCLTAARQKPVIETLEGICRERGARLFRVGKEMRTTIHGNGTFSYRGMGRSHERLVCPFTGRHQLSNAALALGVVDLIGDAGFRIDETTVSEGLKKACWEGRLEILQDSPKLLVDGAHNPAGVATLCRALQHDFPHRRLILLFGVLGDKDYRKMAKRLFPLADRVILTRPTSERALSPEVLRQVAGSYHEDIAVVENPADALRYALSLAEEDDLVCAAGSLYLVGEVKKLQKTRKWDSTYVIPGDKPPGRCGEY